MLWISVASMVNKLSSFGGTLVLALLLMPEVFGAVTLAGTVAIVASLIATPGVGEVLVARQQRRHLWETPAFWLTTLVGVAGFAIAAASAPLGAWVYGDRDLIGLVLLAGLRLPISAVSVLPETLLSIKLRFKFVAALNTFSSLAQMFLTVLFAWIGLGAYSFMLPPVIVAAVRLTIAWSAARPQVNVRPNLRRCRWMLQDTSQVYGVRFLFGVLSQGGYIMLGLFQPQAIVGVFRVATDMGMQGSRLMIANTFSVLYPTLAKMGSDPVRQTKAAFNAAQTLAAVVMPLGFAQVVVAEPVFRMLQREEWLASIPLLQILSIGVALTGFGWASEALLRAQGRFKQLLIRMLILVPISYAAAGTGAWLNGAIGAAFGVAVYTVLHHCVTTWMALGRAGYSVGSLLGLILRPLPAALAATGAGLLVTRSIDSSAGREMALLALVTSGVVFWIVYAAVLRPTAPVLWTRLIDLVRRRKSAVGVPASVDNAGDQK
jgi:PST family polysaccharide transporter